MTVEVTAPRARDDLVEVVVDDRLVVVAPGEQGAHILDARAVLLLDLFDGVRSPQDVATLVAEQFGAPFDRVLDDVTSSQRYLAAAGLLGPPPDLAADDEAPSAWPLLRTPCQSSFDASAEWLGRWTVRAGRWDIGVRTSLPSLTGLLAEALAPWPPGGADVPAHLSISRARVAPGGLLRPLTHLSWGCGPVASAEEEHDLVQHLVTWLEMISRITPPATVAVDGTAVLTARGAVVAPVDRLPPALVRRLHDRGQVVPGPCAVLDVERAEVVHAGGTAPLLHWLVEDETDPAHVVADALTRVRPAGDAASLRAMGGLAVGLPAVALRIPSERDDLLTLLGRP